VDESTRACRCGIRGGRHAPFLLLELVANGDRLRLEAAHCVTHRVNQVILPADQLQTQAQRERERKRCAKLVQGTPCVIQQYYWPTLER
jgi:hypothetical protein